MLISQALATESKMVVPAVTDAAATVAAAAPSATDTFMWNMGFVLLMFVLFYVLLIRPQQKRLKAQQAMLGGLKVGDRVVTGGGLLGTISKIISDAEVEVDLGSIKVVALRYTLTARVTPDTKA